MTSTTSFEKGLQLLDSGDYVQAEEIFQSKLKSAEGSERKSKKYANNLLWLGHVQLKLDDNQNARDNLSKAENLYKELSEVGEELANAMTKHAESLSNLERFDEAQEKLEEANELARAKCGPFSVQVSDTLDTLGVNYLKKNKVEEAEEALSKSLGMRKEIYGSKHSEIAISLTHLSSCYSQADNNTTAQVMAKQALSMQEGIIGTRHPDYGVSLLALSTACVKQGLMTKAEPAAREAVELFDARLPEHHTVNVWALDRLGSVMLATAKNEEAKEIYTRSLKIAQTIWGKTSANTIGSLVGLGLAHLNIGDYESAEKYLSIALDMMEQSSSMNASIEYSILQQLAASYVFQLKIGDAIRLVPSSLRARHTADFNDTMDILHKVFNFTSRQIERWKNEKN